MVQWEQSSVLVGHVAVVRENGVQSSQVLLEEQLLGSCEGISPCFPCLLGKTEIPAEAILGPLAPRSWMDLSALRYILEVPVTQWWASARSSMEGVRGSPF